MTNERMEAIAEEILECQDLKELKALWCFGQSDNNEYGDADCVPHFKAAAARLRNQVEVPTTKIQELECQLALLKARLANNAPLSPVVRGMKKYKLLSTDVSWTTKPQVAAIMEILGAHAKVGDVLEEVQIVAAMEANVGVLQTRQGGKRIWDYYKGLHAEGLMMHGNVEVV